MKNSSVTEKTKAGSGLGEYVYQRHPRFIVGNAYYCRMANAVMPASRDFYDCCHCPLMRGFTQGDQPGLPECWYYDFTGFKDEGYTSAHAEKTRIDRLIGWYDVPEFPDYLYPEDGGIYAASLVEKALQHATVAHKGSFRKGTKIPYIVHPVEVVMIAHELTDDEELIAAAALHDVVEDTIYSKDDIEFVFGERIAALVAAESENKREGMLPEQTWRIRKEETLAHLGRAQKDVKLICLADKLSNIRAIWSDYQKVKDKLWERFNQSDPAAHAWYYGAICDILKEEFGNTRAWYEYVKIVETVFIKV